MKDDLSIGDTLTINKDVITYNSLVFEEGQKVKVRDIEYSGGFYSRFFNTYEPKKISMIKIAGVYGCWSPRTFKEFQP